jgi:iron-sulfur cluster assembly accessory protein
MNEILIITPVALQKLKEALEGTTNKGIRFGVVGGGCSGLSYKMDPAEGPLTEHDIILTMNDHVTFFINPISLPYIKGLTLDYSTSLMDGGFKFQNPNSQSSCGCGTSFGI